MKGLKVIIVPPPATACCDASILDGPSEIMEKRSPRLYNVPGIRKRRTMAKQTLWSLKEQRERAEQMIDRQPCRQRGHGNFYLCLIDSTLHVATPPSLSLSLSFGSLQLSGLISFLVFATGATVQDVERPFFPSFFTLSLSQSPSAPGATAASELSISL